VEKTCFDCSSYLSVPPEVMSEFGICLNEEVFEPFVEELMIGVIPGPCEGLVDTKKFVGDRPACQDFQESEIIEIDDDSPIGQALCRLRDSGVLSLEALELAIAEEQLDRVDWKTVPVDQYAIKLESKRETERVAGMDSLGALISFGNPAAFQVLLRFLSSLPPVTSIKAVHLKIEILRNLNFWKDKSAVVPVLVKELGRIPSNNTTRQWIAEILRFLKFCPLEVIEAPLEHLLAGKTLSPGLRKKVEAILYLSPGL
jgi:hypothetical protein